MVEKLDVVIPDLGGAENVEVVEVLVAVGDRVEAEQSLLTLESDKASMDVPSPRAGTVLDLAVAAGAHVAEGDRILVLEVEAETAAPAAEELPPVQKPAVPEAAPEPEARSEPEPRSASEPRPEPQASPAVVPAPPAGGGDADHHADVLVIGGGPGGYTAAFRAADLGRRVVLVERFPRLGGVCLNVGCIPSKALLHVARVIEEVKDLGEQGVAFGPMKVDLPQLRSFKDGVVERLVGGLAQLAERRGVTVIEGRGSFLSTHELAVDRPDGTRELINFENAIVAVGSRVVELPGLPLDDPRVMDSTQALELADIPKRLLLVGGGIIGLEMAMVYGALGAQLTIVELLDGLVPGCDRDLVRPLRKRLEERLGATIHLRTRVTGITARKASLTATFEGEGAPAKGTFDRILVAVGRRPNGDRIGAEAAGVSVTDRGFIPVDRHQRTNVPHIFAIGDVVGQPMLAHKATHEGKVAAEVAAGEKSAFDARVIPSVAYTDPEIAWVGLTETEAKADGTEYEKATFPWAASGRSLGMGREDGLTKLLFDPRSRRIVGAGIVGPGAGDLISELALAIEMGCEAADIALTIHPHPTLSETVAMAAEAFEGTLTDLYLPKRK